MLTLDQLFDQDTEASKPSISGKWFEIRLTPDLATGEILNIGVGFVRARTREFYFRLLDSAAPFGCLYGPKGREQFGFLLSVTREALAAHGPSASISPQITYGAQRYAQGDSVEQILDSMYHTVVTLARRADVTAEALTPLERHAPRSTETIRKRIRRAFRTNDPKGFTSYWRDEPVTVPQEDRRRPIDMQIWQEEGLFSPRCFATIVSACYRDRHYRSAFLNTAYHDLTIARSFIPAGRGKGGIFILRPDSGDQLEQIDNEIDNTTWALQRKFNIAAYVEQSLERLKEYAVAFAAG